MHVIQKRNRSISLLFYGDDEGTGGKVREASDFEFEKLKIGIVYLMVLQVCFFIRYVNTPAISYPNSFEDGSVAMMVWR